MAEEAFWDRLKGAEILAFQAGFKLLSSNPKFVCWEPLHAIRGNRSHSSVSQEFDLLGHGSILPFNRCVIGVPVRVHIAPAMLSSVPFSSATFAAYFFRCCSGSGLAVSCSEASLLATRGWRSCGSLVLSARWLVR